MSGERDEGAEDGATAGDDKSAAARDEDGLDEDTSNDEEAEEPLDQLGIPMRREPTLDDVRGDGEQHRRLALGCSVLVSLLVLAFWLVRGMLLAG